MTMPEITDRRRLDVGDLQWTVNEFDNGQNYMLIATPLTAAIQFTAHFDAERWGEFQKLVAPCPPDRAPAGDGESIIAPRGMRDY